MAQSIFKCGCHSLSAKDIICWHKPLFCLNGLVSFESGVRSQDKALFGPEKPAVRIHKGYIHTAGESALF